MPTSDWPIDFLNFRATSPIFFGSSSCIQQHHHIQGDTSWHKHETCLCENQDKNKDSKKEKKKTRRRTQQLNSQTEHKQRHPQSPWCFHDELARSFLALHSFLCRRKFRRKTLMTTCMNFAPIPFTCPTSVSFEQP